MFNGDTYQHEFDFNRLSGQLKVIKDLMSDGVWRTLSEIASVTGYHEASISAQLRNLRKERFGGFSVSKQPRGNRALGLYEYKLERTIK